MFYQQGIPDGVDWIRNDMFRIDRILLFPVISYLALKQGKIKTNETFLHAKEFIKCLQSTIVYPDP